jgi:acetyl esterase/lipase
MPFRLFLTALAALMMPVGSPGAESPPSLKKDVAYVENGHARQKLDLRLPADPKGAPVVLWIHGGGWVTGGKENPPIAALTARGYVVASMNYRFSTQAPFPAQLEDARAAVKWLRTHQADYGFDGKRIAAWGHSAGGTMVSLIGARQDKGTEVQAVVNFSGPTDFGLIIKDAIAGGYDERLDTSIGLVAMLLGGPVKNKLPLGLEASPVTHVTAKSAPSLLVFGAKDTLVTPVQGTNLFTAMKKAGATVELLALPNTGHNSVNKETVERALVWTDRALGVKR